MAWPLAARVSTAGRRPAAGRIGLAGPRLLAAQIVEEGLLCAVDADPPGSAGGAALPRYVAAPRAECGGNGRQGGLRGLAVDGTSARPDNQGAVMLSADAGARGPRPDPDRHPHARPSGLLERTCLSCGRGGTRLRDRIRLCPAWPGRRWIGGRPCPARAAFSPGNKAGGCSIIPVTPIAIDDIAVACGIGVGRPFGRGGDVTVQDIDRAALDRK